MSFAPSKMTFGRNVATEVTKDGKLIITIDLKAEGELSGSGKSMVIGSTKGNVRIEGTGGITLGLNCYKPA